MKTDSTKLASGSDPGRGHVLVVEDSLSIRMDLRAQLHRGGFLVTACETKSAALTALRARRFDLAILDVILPDGTGLDLLIELRALYKAAAYVPVILLSTESEVHHRLQGLQRGADLYIGKPYDPDYLIHGAQKIVRPLEQQNHAELAGRKVLIADDSGPYRRKLADALRSAGHDVILAASGEEALSFLALEEVSAVVLDSRMPNLSGVEVCRQIRLQNPRTSILVMVASSEHPTTPGRLREAGATAVFERSPEIPKVAAAILRALAEPRAPSSTRLPSAPGAHVDADLDAAEPMSSRSERATIEPVSERSPEAARASLFEALVQTRIRLEACAARRRASKPGSSR